MTRAHQGDIIKSIKVFKGRGIRVLMALVLACFVPLVGCSNTSKQENAVTSSLREVTTFEGGIAYRTQGDTYWALSLSGSWEEMGRQYGGLVSNDLQNFYHEITEDIAVRGIPEDEQLQTAQEITASLDDDMRAMMNGMSQTSGLTYDQVIELNVSMLILAGELLNAEPTDACSGIAVWGDYTADGTLIFGRNWDIDRAGMLKYMKYLAVVVCNPDTGYAFANVHPLGEVYMETGLNEKGVFIELNNGLESDTGNYPDRISTFAVLAEALNKYDTIDDAARYIAGIPGDMSYIIQVADAYRAVSIERPTYGCRIRTGDQEGLLVAYNSFIAPYPVGWEAIVLPPPALETDPRYVNLIATANSQEYYGKINLETMENLMELDSAHGGAIHDGTVLQVIAVPRDLTLWMRGYKFSDWQQVDLRELFR